MPADALKSYEIHHASRSDCCFICQARSQELYCVREAESMKMIRLCRACMQDNMNTYLLDNTRVWANKKAV